MNNNDLNNFNQTPNPQQPINNIPPVSNIEPPKPKRNKPNIIIIGIIAVVFVAGLIFVANYLLGNKNNTNENNSNINNNKNSKNSIKNKKAKCTAVDCIKLIDFDSTIDEINTIIGFEGELIDNSEYFTQYYWAISNNSGIRYSYNMDFTRGTVELDVKHDNLKNSKVDLSESRFQTIKSKVLDEYYKYDQVKSYLAGVDGTITMKTSEITEYTWVSNSGGYLTVRYDNRSSSPRYATGEGK